jgi:DEAD/DEAH box helicase domain-containing protein
MGNNKNQTSFFDYWINSKNNEENITHIKKIEPSEGLFQEFPSFLNEDIISLLIENNIKELYTHQTKAIEIINSNKNVGVTSGPSSGKSLIYLLPILNDILNGKNSTAFFLFPTKALAYDQLQHIRFLIDNSNLDIKQKKILATKISVYDGDTPKEFRINIRKQAQVILTNPDMLHIGILPNHDLWENFLDNLKYLVLDEAHVYTGVFGSHVANVIRRLKRILSLYRKSLIYICTTATIGNPTDFLSNLIEEELEFVQEDGAPKTGKKVVFYNPPLVNQELGIRKSLHQETLRIVEEFSSNEIQALVFQRSRKEVEKSLKIMQENSSLSSKVFTSGYRSGYLAQDRRKIEEEFRAGKIKTLFSTNALELGVDIGNLQCVILSGYPGTISSTWQQIGRSGRTLNESIAIFIASANPIDQFIIKRPEYLLVNNPENALINANNPNILLDHLVNSILEISFIEGENFGNLDWQTIEPILEQLLQLGIIYKSNNKYSVITNNNPREPFSLRNINSNSMKLIEVTNQEKKIIGEVDYASSFWMVHPNAIYLHLGEQYLVEELNLQNCEVVLSKSYANYFTEPTIKTTYEILNQKEEFVHNNLNIQYGEIQVTQQVTGYKEILWETNQKINIHKLDLPETQLETEAFWFYIPNNLKDQLISENLWLNYQNDYGPGWKKYKDLIRKRDHYTCQRCGIKEENSAHHVHHIKPYKLFDSMELANHPSNLITLCATCHKLAETQVRVRSGLAGLSYLFRTLSPLFVMCSMNDIGVVTDTKNTITGFENSIIVYDNIPYGLGLSYDLFNKFPYILHEMYLHVSDCGCHNGCPSCVGPISDEGYGGKTETNHLLKLLLNEINGSSIQEKA